jgi:hypothetical protein
MRSNMKIDKLQQLKKIQESIINENLINKEREIIMKIKDKNEALSILISVL